MCIDDIFVLELLRIQAVDGRKQYCSSFQLCLWLCQKSIPPSTCCGTKNSVIIMIYLSFMYADRHISIERIAFETIKNAGMSLELIMPRSKNLFEDAHLRCIHRYLFALF